MPGINDDPRQVQRILEAAGDAGAVGVSGIALHLRGEVRGIFMEWLRSYRPDLVERYESLYRRGAYAPREEQDRLRGLLRITPMRTGHEPPPNRSPADTRGVRRAPPAARAPAAPRDRVAPARDRAAPVGRAAPRDRAAPPSPPARQEALF